MHDDIESSNADRKVAEDLSEFGYVQQLRRSMGPFSSFAVSFSLISVTTGVFAGFSVGIQNAGPSLVWSWLVVLVGQLLTALVLAELAMHFPLSGYGYQWSSRLVNARFGYFVGWLLLMQFLTGFPGVCKAFGDYFHQFVGMDSLLDGGGSWVRPAHVTVFVISTIAIIHLMGIRLVSWINDAGVMAELGGVVLITVVLLALVAFRQPEPLTFLMTSTNSSGQPAALAGFAASLLLGAWCLTGFEAAADLAEETHNPRATVPRAVVLSLLSSGGFGFLLLAALVLSIDRGGSASDSSLGLASIQQSQTPLLDLIYGRLGAAAGVVGMVIVFISIFACGIASMATATRLVFSMARDNMLPFSGILRRVHPIHNTPRNSILLVWIGTSIVVLVLDRIEWITSISAVAGYLGYTGILLSAWIGLAGRRAVDGYSLGRWRTPITAAAIVWSLVVVGAIAFSSLHQGDLVPLSATGSALIVGGTLYAATIRGRIVRGEAGPPTVRQGAPSRIDRSASRSSG